jgi:hypothetical protein
VIALALLLAQPVDGIGRIHTYVRTALAAEGRAACRKAARA